MGDQLKLSKCTPRQARKFIIQCIEAGLVPNILGSPGIGKSAIARGVGDDYKLHLIDERLSTADPTDMSGLPGKHRNKPDRATFHPFDIFPLEDDKIPEGKDGWLLFLDEANAAPRSVQAAAYKLVLDRMVGQHRLHPNVAIVMAGNLSTDRAITNPISTAMQSRLIHMELEVSFQEWLEDVALPQKYDSRIIGYLSQYESKLMDFKPDHQDKTFCCPRTWEFVNRLLSKREEDGSITPRPVTNEMGILLSGAITSGVATEFVQFTAVYSRLISINDIISDPKQCPVPSDLSLKWATVTHMLEKINPKNFDDLATYVDRFNDIAFKILFYRSVLVRQPGLRSHPKFGPHVANIVKYLTETPNSKP